MDIFGFISDDSLRASLVQDYTEMETCLREKALKAVYVLSGSIIEAVLVDHLLTVQPKGIGRDQVLSMDLGKLIETCNGLGMLSQKSMNLLTVLRTYRNLIHPDRELRLAEKANLKEALIARHLVDIVLDEIHKKKRENYGYTAEQITEKILSDASSDSIIEHLVKEMNDGEIRRLLLEKLPTAFYQLKENEDPFNPINAIKSPLAKCFSKILLKSNYETQSLVMKQHVRIVKEQSSFHVECYDSAFATCRYLDHLEYSEKELLIDHFLSLLDGSISDETLAALDGIGTHLRGEKAVLFMQKIVRAVLQTEDGDFERSAIKRLIAEYSIMPESEQKMILERLGKLATNYELKLQPDRTKQVKSISDSLKYWDVPF